MGGFFRFLLGGALGAAVGIAISQKRSATSRKEAEAPPASRAKPAPVPSQTMERVAEPVAPTVSAVPQECAPVVSMPAAVPVTPPAPLTAPPAPPPVAAAPPPVAAAPPVPPAAPAFVSEGAPTVAPIAPRVVTPPVEVSPPAAVYEVPPMGAFEDFPIRVAAMSAALAGTPVEEAPAVPVIGEAPDAEPIFAEIEMAETAEIVVTPEVLEEPVPGMGWEPSSTLLEEEAFDDFLPMVPEEFLPSEAPEVERLSAEVAAQWSTPPTEAPPVEAPAAPTAPAVDVPLAPVIGAAAAAATAQAAAPVAPAGPVVEVLVGDDLRARIEATRRRIREELEQPFARMEDLGLAEPPFPVEAARPEPVVAPSAEPVIGRPMTTGPAVGAPQAAAPGPVAPPAPAAAPAPTPVTAPAPVYVPAGGPVPPAGDDDGAGLEYEAMRARIEMTRSRLKAKAFDAMMAGESALLARDPNGAQPKPLRIDGVDKEIEHTVESSLREQED